MTSHEMASEAITKAWKEAHARHPGTAKSTFVHNCLFNGNFNLGDLGAWILEQDDLADQVWEGGSDCHFEMLQTPQGDGTSVWRAKPDGKRVIIRIRMETIHQGESTITRSEQPWTWDHDTA